MMKKSGLASLFPYADPIASRLRLNAIRSCIAWGLWLCLIGGLSAYGLTAIFRGEGEHVIVGIVLTVLVISLFLAWGVLSAIYRGQPRLLSYFSQEVPGCGLTTGPQLIRHSKVIDEAALTYGFPSITSFLSEDDLMGQELTWHNPADAISMVDGLLTIARTRIPFSDIESELLELRIRLEYANANHIRFCFLIRTATGTSALEWERRKGFC